MLLLEQFENLTLHPQNAARLKELVLQLAVQGKLTENWRESNTQAEKTDVVDGYYTVPSSWFWDEFQNVCDFNIGRTPPTKESKFWEGDTPWVSIADMKDYGFLSATKKTLSEEGLKKSFNNTLTPKGTLLMSFKLTIGRTTILDIDACHNEAIISIYPNQKVIRDYLFWFLPLFSNWGNSTSAIKGNTLNKKIIEKLKLPLPPLAEQEAIVARVEELIQKIEELEKQTADRIQLKQHLGCAALQQLTAAEGEELEQNWLFLKQHFQTMFDEAANVKKLRETILQLAVQGKLTATWRKQNPTTETAFELLKRIQAEKAQLVKENKIKKEKPLEPISEDKVPYALPEGWVWCRLREITLYSEAGKSYQALSEQAVGNEYGIIKTSAITSRRFLSTENKLLPNQSINYEPILIRKGDLLFCRASGSKGLAGASCLVENDPNVKLILSDKSIRYHFPKFINTKYIQSFNCSNIAGSYYDGLSTDKTTSMNNITREQFDYLPIPLPPLAEQEAIFAKVDQLMQLCNELEQQIQQSEEEAEALMQAVVHEALQVQEEIVF